jgi:hypothetical protein
VKIYCPEESHRLFKRMVMKLVLGFKRDAVAESWIKFLITIENEQTYG